MAWGVHCTFVYIWGRHSALPRISLYNAGVRSTPSIRSRSCSKHIHQLHHILFWRALSGQWCWRPLSYHLVRIGRPDGLQDCHAVTSGCSALASTLSGIFICGLSQRHSLPLFRLWIGKLCATNSPIDHWLNLNLWQKVYSSKIVRLGVKGPVHCLAYNASEDSLACGLGHEVHTTRVNGSFLNKPHNTSLTTRPSRYMSEGCQISRSPHQPVI